MQHDPNTPSLVSLTEQPIARAEPIQREDNVQTLVRLVEQYGYRKASLPRARNVVKTIEVKWSQDSTAKTDISSEPAIIEVLRQNLEAFLNRAERIGKLSTMADRKAMTMEAQPPRQHPITPLHPM